MLSGRDLTIGDNNVTISVSESLSAWTINVYVSNCEMRCREGEMVG